MRYQSLFLFILLFFTSCSGAKNPVTQSEKIVENIEQMFIEQGVDYSAAALVSVLMEKRDSLVNLKGSLSVEEEMEGVQKSIEKIDCFRGLLAIDVFQSGRLPTGVSLEEGESLGQFRRIAPEIQSLFDFLPQEEGLISVRGVLRFYETIQNEIPDYSFAYSAPAFFSLFYGDMEEAIRLAEAALKLNEKDFLALRTLLVALYGKEEHEKDFEYFVKQYKKIVPDSFLVDYFLSRIARVQGDMKDAIRFAENSISKIRSGQLIFYLAELYEEDGNLEKARYHYASLLAISKYAGKPFYLKAAQEVERIAKLMEEEKKNS